MHQVIFHLSLKKQSYYFRKVKSDDKKLIDFILLSLWKTKFWGMSLEGLFQTSDSITHRTHIVRTSCRQLLTRSGIFCPLVDVVYWLCGLKFVYPKINLAFLGIIVEVKLPAKFYLHSFEWFCLQINKWCKIFFLSGPRHCDRGLIVV